MVTLDRRVRLLGAVLDRTVRPIAGMSPAKRQRLRHPAAPIAVTRAVTALLNGRRASGVIVKDLFVPGPDGAIPVRAYLPPAGSPQSPQSPHALLPVVVDFHGGGWMFGDLDTADWRCSQVAARMPAVVLAAAYRLAPEHPAPAARRDAYGVTAWAAAHAQDLGGAPERLAVMGESAGGNLAATVALESRDRGGPAIAAQALLYPATDLTLSAPSLHDRPDGATLTTADVHAYADAYLGVGRVGHARADPRDPLLSPLHAPDLTGLPPAIVVTAGDDPIRDDGRRYAERLRHAGVPVDYYDYPDTPHGFFSFPTLCRAAAPALGDLVAALDRALTLR